MKKIFHLEIEKCLDCPYGGIPICDLTNAEDYDSNKIHPKCPLPDAIEIPAGDSHALYVIKHCDLYEPKEIKEAVQQLLGHSIKQLLEGGIYSETDLITDCKWFAHYFN